MNIIDVVILAAFLLPVPPAVRLIQRGVPKWLAGAVLLLYWAWLLGLGLSWWILWATLALSAAAGAVVLWLGVRAVRQ